MKKFWAAIKRLLADAANAYRLYWHRENAKLRAICQQEQKSAETMAAHNMYDWFSVFLLQAVRGCAVTVHFEIPEHPVLLFHRQWLQQDSCGNTILVYRCRYHSGYGLFSQDFQHVLETELDEISAFWGWVSDVPVSVRLSPEHIAYIQIPLNSIVQIYNGTGGF